MKLVLRKSLDWVAGAARFTVVALAVVMLAVLSLQVVLRFAMGQALSWSEELALACFSWSMLLAIALGVRDHIHVRMDLLTDALPPVIQAVLQKLTALAIAALGISMAWAGNNYVAFSSGSTSAAIGFPTAYLYASAPVCGVLIAVFALEILFMGPASHGSTPASPAAPSSR